MARRNHMDLARVQAEATQAYSTRAPLYDALTRKLKRRVVGFYTSFEGAASIEDPDAELLEQVIAHTPGPQALTLIVSSPGGDGVEAERIVRACRKLSGDDFEVIVPRMAKSAATLICMGANQIHMSPTSELGPIDPQVPWRSPLGLRLFPTGTLVAVYDSLMKSANSTSGNVEPYLQQLQSFDAGAVQQWRTYETLTRDIAVKLLGCHQMKGQTKAAITKRIATFTDSGKTLDHSRPIFAEDAAAAGLVVNVSDPASDLWKKVWELYLRCSHLLRTFGTAKLCESATQFASQNGQ